MPLTEGGYVRRFWRDRLNAMIERFREFLPDGQEWAIHDDNDLGVELGVLSLSDDDLDRKQEAVFLSLSPRTAPGGKALNDVLSFRAPEGLFAAKAARGFLIAEGDPGDVVARGETFPIGNDVQLVVLGEVAIPNDGVAAVPVQADTLGVDGNVAAGELSFREGGIDFSNQFARTEAQVSVLGTRTYRELPAGEDGFWQSFDVADFPMPASIEELAVRVRNPLQVTRVVRLSKVASDPNGEPFARTEDLDVEMGPGEEREARFFGLGFDFSDVDEVRLSVRNDSADGEPVELAFVEEGSGWMEEGIEQGVMLELWAAAEVDGRIRGGRAREESHEARERYIRSLDRPGADRPASIVSKLARDPEIQDYRVFPNWTLNDRPGLPKKSTRVVVLGGRNERVGRLLAWGAGTQNWVGSRAVIVTDPDDDDQTYVVRFDRAVEKPLEVRVRLDVGSLFPRDGHERIRRRIVRHVGGVDQGGTPRRGLRLGRRPSHALITGMLDRIPGIEDALVEVRWRGAVEWTSCERLPIAFDEKAIIRDIENDVTFGRLTDAAF